MLQWKWSQLRFLPYKLQRLAKVISDYVINVDALAQSPWLPELSALFDDIKKIAPGNAYEVIGYVTKIYL